MEKVYLTCIGCPMGCQLEVIMDGGNVLDVSGNTCRRGQEYARKEVTNPTRIVTTTVKIFASKSGCVVLPCKTASDVPRDRIFDVIRDLADVMVKAPVRIGDVVKANVAGTGVNMIATKEIL